VYRVVISIRAQMEKQGGNMEKTSTQKFINVAAAFWKASAELAEVESGFSREYGRRDAHAAMERLDKELKLLIDHWNGNLEDGEQVIIECSSSLTDTKGCEIFTAKPNEGMCEGCAARAYDRQQERLMEDGGVDDSAYRRDMRDAGRAHLLA
jgi:uncharacterized protein YukE